MARRVVHLLVPSPDRRRVLARPNGVAGWTLPVAAVAGDPWSDHDLEAAGRVLGTRIRAVAEVVPGTWEVEALDRVPAAGVTWIGLEEVARLGADATAVRLWASRGEG